MMQQEQVNSNLSVEALCAALDVSPSGYYAWCKREVSPHQQADVRLGEEIERVFVESRRTYGSHRIWLGLRERGIRTSRKRVERLMRQRGWRSVRARQRRFGLTQAGQSAYFAPNLLNQDFAATTINKKWVTDTTAIPTREGWLYLVSVMDLFSHQVVSWAMGEHHDADLATSALDMAIGRAHPPAGLILHSDRGSEFANAKFHDRAAEDNIRLSMSGTGNGYDNTTAESFFATVKLEAIPEGIFASRQAARAALFDYIDVFYNRQRLHSGIGYTPPISRAACVIVTLLNWG
jgi:putative transposase